MEEEEIKDEAGKVENVHHIIQLTVLSQANSAAQVFSGILCGSSFINSKSITPIFRSLFHHSTQWKSLAGLETQTH